MRNIFGCRLLLGVFMVLCIAAPSLGEHTKASVYAKSLKGRKTASGGKYHPEKMTAASKHLPLGTKVQVKNQKTGKKAVVTITDRGPFVKGRGLDLSSKAARKIGLKGVAPVEVRPVKYPKKAKKKG